jgi:SH3-like domain-containing protein
VTGFHATHRIVPDGAPAWDEPDPLLPATQRLDPSLPVRVIDETTGWARVQCSNSWETWVDARNLVALPFRPTHAVPPAGLDARTEPDAARPPDARLDPGLAVEVLEAPSGWALVRFANGWEAWVDGAALVPVAVPHRSGILAGARGVVLAVALPAAVVVVGSLLPWFGAGSRSANAWDIELVALFTHEATDVNLRTGPVLLGLALVAIVLGALRVPRAAGIACFGLLGGLTLVVGVAGLMLYADLPAPQPALGVGMLLTVAGGITLAVAGYLAPGAGITALRRRS